MLHTFRLVAYLSVDIHYSVDNLKCVAWQSDEAFHIVLAFIDGACDDSAEVSFVVIDAFSSELSDELVVGDVALINLAHGVACREVEYYRVVSLDLGEARKTQVRNLRMLDV